MNLSFIDVILGLALSLIILVMMARNDDADGISDEGYLIVARIGPLVSDSITLRLKSPDRADETEWIASPAGKSGHLGRLQFQVLSDNSIKMWGELLPNENLSMTRNVGAGRDLVNIPNTPLEWDVQEPFDTGLQEKLIVRLCENIDRLSDLNSDRMWSGRGFNLGAVKDPLEMAAFHVISEAEIPEVDRNPVQRYLAARFPLLLQRPWSGNFQSPPFAQLPRQSQVTEYYTKSPPVAIYGYVGGRVFYYSSAMGDLLARSAPTSFSASNSFTITTSVDAGVATVNVIQDENPVRCAIGTKKQ